MEYNSIFKNSFLKLGEGKYRVTKEKWSIVKVDNDAFTIKLPRGTRPKNNFLETRTRNEPITTALPKYNIGRSVVYKTIDGNENTVIWTFESLRLPDITDENTLVKKLNKYYLKQSHKDFLMDWIDNENLDKCKPMYCYEIYHHPTCDIKIIRTVKIVYQNKDYIVYRRNGNTKLYEANKSEIYNRDDKKSIDNVTNHLKGLILQPTTIDIALRFYSYHDDLSIDEFADIVQVYNTTKLTEIDNRISKIDEDISRFFELKEKLLNEKGKYNKEDTNE